MRINTIFTQNIVTIYIEKKWEEIKHNSINVVCKPLKLKYEIAGIMSVSSVTYSDVNEFDTGSIVTWTVLNRLHCRPFRKFIMQLLVFNEVCIVTL